jgi:hypothetical protein
MDEEASEGPSSDQVAAAKERERLPAEHRITVRVIPDLLGREPIEVWTADLGESEGGVLALEIQAELDGALLGADAYELSSTRKYVEWGASAINVDVLLTLAEWVLAGVAGNATYDVLRRAIRGFANRSLDHESGLREPMTAEQAAHLGRWKLRYAFAMSDEDADNLVVVGEDRRHDGSRVIRYELGDLRFEAEMVEEDGLVWIARVGWQQREDD